MQEKKATQKAVAGGRAEKSKEDWATAASGATPLSPSILHPVKYSTDVFPPLTERMTARKRKVNTKKITSTSTRE